jgi:hypothetical protein
MKHIVLSFIMAAFLGSVNAYAQPADVKTLGQLAASLSKAYKTKDLGRLDRGRPAGTVKFTIEHSLAGDDDKDRFEIRSFRRFAQAERWLRKRGVSADVPFRQVSSLKLCRKGTCSFESIGMLHNQLYLRRFQYAYRDRRPVITSVFMVDGD